MTAVTVTTQAELDRALADLAVTEVTIDAPRTELITLADTAGKYVEITGETRVEPVAGRLFTGGNTMADLRSIVDEITAAARS